MSTAPKFLSLWNRQESSTSILEFLVEPAQSKKEGKKERKKIAIQKEHYILVRL